MRSDDEETAPKKSYTLWIVLGGIGMFLVFACCCVPGGGYFYWDFTTKRTAEERQKKVDEEPGLAVSAVDLSKAYIENLAAANTKFNDKVLVVTGRVTGIDGNTVSLQPGTVPNQITVGQVNCTFSDKNRGQLATMKVNDNVTINIFRLPFSCVCGEDLESRTCCHYAACVL